MNTYYVILTVLLAATGWDTFTTLIGTIQTLGGEARVAIAGIIAAVVVTTVLVRTRHIIALHDDLPGFVWRAFWFVCLGFDIYTGWLGNRDFVYTKELDASTATVLLLLTLVISASPILFSLRDRVLGDPKEAKQPW